MREAVERAARKQRSHDAIANILALRRNMLTAMTKKNFVQHGKNVPFMIRMVVDASVAIKWFFQNRDNETDCDKALAIL